MDRVFPVYTQTNNCHDCFKCLRQCPVKAIRLEEGHARVLPELCVSCGLCVEVCPAKAKCIRDDRSRVEGLLASGRTVVAEDEALVGFAAGAYRGRYWSGSSWLTPFCFLVLLSL